MFIDTLVLRLCCFRPNTLHNVAVVVHVAALCTRQHFAESSIPKIHDAVYIVCKIFDSNIGIYLF